MGMNRDYMHLEYQPASSLHSGFSSQPVTPQMKRPRENEAESKIVSAESPMGLLQPEQKYNRKEKWNLEQIGDFVRKLGFLDEQREEGGVKIKHFILLNQVYLILFTYVSSHYVMCITRLSTSYFVSI